MIDPTFIFLSSPSLRSLLIVVPRGDNSATKDPSIEDRKAYKYRPISNSIEDIPVTMAVIPSVPGLTVTIAVDGQALPEYDNPGIQGSETLTRDDFHLPNGHNDSLPHIMKFVESTPGKPFAIWVDRDPSFQLLSHHIAFHILLDGWDLGRYGDETSQKDTWSLEVSEKISKCPEGDETTYTSRQFYFSELKISKHFPAPST
jgi:hypothetical protein